MYNQFPSWNEVEASLNLAEEDKAYIAFEEDLIDTLVAIREQNELTQSELAKLTKIKQPAIARIEKSKHSPRVDTLLHLLVPMGYRLAIVPIKNK